MEWQQLIGFYHVARLGSFTKAGTVTLRTQSALSQQIKALEEEFGCQLFERIGTRRLKLTPAGKRFLEFPDRVRVYLERFPRVELALLDRHGIRERRAEFTLRGKRSGHRTGHGDQKPSMLARRNLEFLPLDHYFNSDHIALIMRKDKATPLYQRVLVNTLLGEPVLAGP